MALPTLDVATLRWLADDLTGEADRLWAGANDLAIDAALTKDTDPRLSASSRSLAERNRAVSNAYRAKATRLRKIASQLERRARAA